MSSLGNKYWRSLGERAVSAEFERWRRGEFPETVDDSEIGRRDFLRLMGASIALGGLGACTRQPVEKIVPYVKQPEELTPGKALHFATATTLGGYGQGIIVRSNEGRPTKIEGNPDHPASLGGTTIWAQADLLDLYDPDRAQSITRRGQVSTWDDFLQQLTQMLQEQTKTNGAGLRILTRTVTSPTLLGQIVAVLKKFPGARWSQWDPLPAASASEELIYNFADATTVVALDSDFLYLHPAAPRHARDFASTRRITRAEEAGMSRFYAAEPTPTVTGSNADHRIAVESRQIAKIAAALAAVISGGPADPSLPGPVGKWVTAAAADLLQNRGAGIVITGETQSTAVQTVVRQINDSLGNIGSTISPRPPIAVHPAEVVASLRSLIAEMNSGAVKILLMLDGDPAYDAPADFEFAKALTSVETAIHHSLFVNQTSKLSQWHLPAAHFLESWSDALAFDGTTTIVQPLIEPLYSGRTAHEVVEALIQQPVRSAYEIVHQGWSDRVKRPDFEARWNDAVQRGVAPEPQGQKPTRPGVTVLSPAQANTAAARDLEILFRADPNILDGRYANNGWLQELPRPLTKLTWDNAALVSPELAAELSLATGDVVELEFRGRKIVAPIWIQPGQARNSVAVHLGYGRSEAGRIGKGVGFDAFALRTADALWAGDGLKIHKTSAPPHKFASTQQHHSIEGRHMFRAGTLTQFQNDPQFALRETEVPKRDETLYHPDEFKKAGYAWGMVIDLNTCIGCNACTIACQAENNIPVVGKDQVSRGREMHWIRIDHYFEGAPASPEMNHQPVPCMHCEHAPCELVCPVGATVHDDEGLNLQVYNRCVGTRYCSNNCPYKVRRFNFFELNGRLSPTEKLSKNPDVTVRSRGVMEKCTYCLQRINAARYAAELQNRPIRDGEVMPACAQACPAESIVFGNLSDPESHVATQRKLPLNYAMLSELNTRPRTTYLAKLRNLSPQIVAS